MDSDSAVKLKLIRLARYALEQIPDIGMDGSSSAWHQVFHSSVQALRKVMMSEIPPERLAEFEKVYDSLAADGRFDGGPGSGNWGHVGRPGKVGGSGKGGGVHNRSGTKESGYSSAAKERAKEKAAKSASQSSSKSGGSHPVAEGKNIAASYTGNGDIKSVIRAQGFDGLPKCVGRKEFDKAVEASTFIAQRTYAATSQEVLDAYHEQLCNGEWYVECSEGGAQYGQGMYCAADYTGKLSEGIRSEMTHYAKLGSYQGKPYVKTETLTLDPSAKIVRFQDVDDAYSGQVTDERAGQFIRDYAEPKLKRIGEKYGEQAEIAARWKFGGSESGISWITAGEAAQSIGEKMTAKIIEEADSMRNSAYSALNDYRKRVRQESEEIRKKYADVGAYAAVLGYDAINADGHGASGSYTVILNRTKTIILDESVPNKDGAEHAIRFRLGADGDIYAIKDREVIGCVYVHGASDNGTDGVSASGNTKQDARNRYNFVTPIDKSSNSDRIKLRNPHTDGGPGSGNFGHKGVPGQVGGSAPSNGGSSGGTGNATGKSASSSSAAPSNGGSSGSGSASNSTGATANSATTTSATGNGSNAPIANNAQPNNARSSSQTKREKITKRLVGQTTHDGIEIKSISKHAFNRIAGRKISMGRIEKMITTGKVSNGNQPDTKVYDIDGSRMVIDSKTGTVISIMWRNKK